MGNVDMFDKGSTAIMDMIRKACDGDVSRLDRKTAIMMLRTLSDRVTGLLCMSPEEADVLHREVADRGGATWDLVIQGGDRRDLVDVMNAVLFEATQVMWRMALTHGKIPERPVVNVSIKEVPAEEEAEAEAEEEECEKGVKPARRGDDDVPANALLLRAWRAINVTNNLLLDSFMRHMSTFGFDMAECDGCDDADVEALSDLLDTAGVRIAKQLLDRSRNRIETSVQRYILRLDPSGSPPPDLCLPDIERVLIPIRALAASAECSADVAAALERVVTIRRKTLVAQWKRECNANANAQQANAKRLSYQSAIDEAASVTFFWTVDHKNRSKAYGKPLDREAMRDALLLMEERPKKTVGVEPRRIIHRGDQRQQQRTRIAV